MRKTKRGWKNYLTLREVNQVIRVLTFSDLIFMSGFGLLAPIFAIYITDQIEGATLAVVGIASTIYLVTKSLGQIPAAYFIDKIRGERDDYWSMVVGSLIVSAIPLLYIAISNVWALYLVQFIYGFSVAFTFPSWMAIFTRHVDKNKEGFEWGYISRSLIWGEQRQRLWEGLWQSGSASCHCL